MAGLISDVSDKKKKKSKHAKEKETGWKSTTNRLLGNNSYPGILLILTSLLHNNPSFLLSSVWISDFFFPLPLPHFYHPIANNNTRSGVRSWSLLFSLQYISMHQHHQLQTFKTSHLEPFAFFQPQPWQRTNKGDKACWVSFENKKKNNKIQEKTTKCCIILKIPNMFLK